MTKKELARRILMLTMPWPLSRLFPSSIRIGLSLWPGDLKEVYADPQGAAYIPGVGATQEKVFMPLSAPAAPIFSDVVSWPSDTTAIQSLPSTIPSSPPEGSTLIDALVDSYWTDAQDETSYTFSDVDDSISADGSFNLYPTDTIGDDSEIEAITIDFETSETIGTVNIIEQNVDEPAPVNIICDDDTNEFPWDQFADTHKAGQTQFFLDHAFRVTSVYIKVGVQAGSIVGHTYRCEIWTSELDVAIQKIIALKRSSNTISGNDAWNKTWVQFTFDPPASLAADTKYALLFCRLDAQDVNQTKLYNSAANEIEGQFASFTETLNHKSTNVCCDSNIKFDEVDITGPETIATFSDVTPGQKLSFSVKTMKNMYIQIIDPSNAAEGIKVTGLTANTYGFSTG